MKKGIFYISILCLALPACSKLDLVPVSTKSTEGFYQTETHFNQAVLGVYNGLRSAWVTTQTSYMLTESRSDNTFQGQEYNDGQVSRFEVTPELPILYTAWTQYYSYIHRANTILANSADVKMEEVKRKQFEGEAKFLRALFYFDLVRLFGGVPMVTTPQSIDESYAVGRSGVEQVYDQIVLDLTEAAASLPDAYTAADKGRATKWAAKAFLGKVYVFRSGYPLKKNEWATARQLFREVMDSGQFEFFTKYEDIYNYTFEGGKQQVFSVPFKSGASGNGNPYPTRNASNNIIPTTVADGGLPFGGSPFNLFISNNILNSYEPGDLRKDVSILSRWKNKSGDFVTTLPTAKKYQNGPVVAANDWDIDWIGMSYTDVLMMYAESLNEIGYAAGGEAFTILNNVRQRAGLTPKTTADIPDQTSFRLWVEKERRAEFAFENLRWFDLVRTDRAYDVMKDFLRGYGLENNLKSRDQYIYPIPQTVRNITPIIEQNPGYN